MRKVVSFSLWGTASEYVEGAIRALESARIYYPDWEYWFYVRSDVPKEHLEALRNLGAKIILIVYPQSFSGMVLRFLPASDSSVDVFIVRDTDSVITYREAQAVSAWLKSDKDIHIMRDHPTHILPIMGGLWGCRHGVLSKMKDLLESHACFDKYGCDQKFLAKTIYPNIKDVAFINSEVCKLPGETVHPFPTQRIGLEFIGRANREGFDKQQDEAMSKWLQAGQPLAKVPNIYSLKGRLWLLLQRFNRAYLLLGRLARYANLPLL